MALLKILNCCHNLQMYCCSFHGSPPHNLAMTNVYGEQRNNDIKNAHAQTNEHALLLLLEIILNRHIFSL